MTVAGGRFRSRLGLVGRLCVGLTPVLLAGCGEATAPPPATPRAEPAHFARDMDGTWAATPQLCGRAVWRISAAAVVSDSGVACALDGLRPAASGWTGSARCADRRSGSLEFTPSAGEPRSLVLSGPPFNTPVTLVRCAPGGEPPARDPHAPLEAAAAIDLAIASEAAGVEGRRDPANAVVRAAWWKDGALIKLVEPSVARDRRPRRVYYFLPGEETPFLVRGRNAVFGFVEGRLVTVFSPEGEILGDLERARFASEARGALRDAQVARSLARTLAPAQPSDTSK